MDQNRTPCSIEADLVGYTAPAMVKPTRMWPDRSSLARKRGEVFYTMPVRDFSPWLTPEALQAFDPDAREAGEFILEIAKAAAVNNERERRRAARGGSK